eukprot:SAG22_NODE_731_length_7588_cov_6.237281_8_plen_153_part_00
MVVRDLWHPLQVGLGPKNAVMKLVPQLLHCRLVVVLVFMGCLVVFLLSSWKERFACRQQHEIMIRLQPDRGHMLAQASRRSATDHSQAIHCMRGRVTGPGLQVPAGLAYFCKMCLLLRQLMLLLLLPLLLWAKTAATALRWRPSAWASCLQP